MYTDGAYTHTIDIGGYGIVIINNKPKEGERAMRCSMGNYRSTNSFRMEVMSIIKALEHVHDVTVLIYNDALPSMKAFFKGNSKSHSDLFKYYTGVIERRRIYVDYAWVKGHSGDTYNEMANYLAQQAVYLKINRPRVDVGVKPYRKIITKEGKVQFIVNSVKR